MDTEDDRDIDEAMAKAAAHSRAAMDIKQAKNLSAQPDEQAAPVAWQSVVAAVRAVGAEAARRGEMFPQTRDEQDEDRAAVRRVAEMVEWYATKGGAVAMSLPNWPRATPTAPQVQAETVPWVTRPTGRTIPDLTGREHVCDWQRQVQAETVDERAAFERDALQRVRVYVMTLKSIQVKSDGQTYTHTHVMRKDVIDAIDKEIAKVRARLSAGSAA